MFQNVGKIGTHIACSITFFPKIVLFMRSGGEVWYSQTGHTSQYYMAHDHCMLDK